MIKIFILIFILLILMACSSKGYWLIPQGLDESDFQRDNYQCDYQAQTLAYASGYQHHQSGSFAIIRIRNRTYFDCMTSKGYQWIKD
jgi:hypothetical protein